MADKKIQETIRQKLFYGSADYTKNQPDLFIPHRFQLLAPSQGEAFLEKLKASLPAEDLLLYIHLPFCSSECVFCNSFPHRTDRRTQEEYLAALIREIKLFAASGIFAGKQVRGIYFGGGTPTVFSNRDLDLILHVLRELISFAENCSITIEAHPATLVKTDRIRDISKLGFNRISIGCQTFDQKVLQLCRRSHRPEQIKEIIDTARSIGIATNIDMMTGLPGQTLAGVKQDLSILADIHPDAVEYIRHEIVNPLVAALYRENPDLVVADDDLFTMVHLTQQWMMQHGYEQNGRFSSGQQWEYRYHWLHEMPIIAFGSRTRSYTPDIFYDKHEEMADYLQAVKKGILPVIRYISLNEKEQMFRCLFLSLQLSSGMDIAEFKSRFRQDPIELFAEVLDPLMDYGCINIDASKIKLTEFGACFVEDVCDYIMDALLREESGQLTRTPHSNGKTSTRLADAG